MVTDSCTKNPTQMIIRDWQERRRQERRNYYARRGNSPTGSENGDSFDRRPSGYAMRRVGSYRKTRDPHHLSSPMSYGATTDVRRTSSLERSESRGRKSRGRASSPHSSHSAHKKPGSTPGAAARKSTKPQSLQSVDSQVSLTTSLLQPNGPRHQK